MQNQNQYTALIYGATGAVGKQLVNHLLNSPLWKKVIVIVRRQLPQWKNHPKKQKLHIQALNDMDQLLKPQKFTYQNVDALFCALGSMVKFGEETFIKVDKTYPLKAADIALRNKIPHYLLVSSMGASSNSCLLYPRTKGEVQLQLKNIKLPLLTIMRPGLIANRTNQRFGQKLINCLCGCCIPKIEAIDLGQTLMIVAQRDILKSRSSKQVVQLYQNSQLLNIFQQGTSNPKLNQKTKQTLLNKK